MTDLIAMLRDARGASAVMTAIVGGLACVFWVEISHLTGVHLSDLIEIVAHKLGFQLN